MREAEPCDYPNMLRVVEVNPEEEGLTETLGITDERMNELMDKAVAIWNEKDMNISKSLVKISRLFDNANEMAMVILTIGKLSERNRPEKSKEKK